MKRLQFNQHSETKSDSSSEIGCDSVYFIKNKDKVIASFRWQYDSDTEEYAIVDVQNISAPFWISNNIERWISSRQPTKHRAHIDELLRSCGLNDLKSVIDFSKGLSLNDTFWIDNTDLKWLEVNLYDNPFDETIARIAFEGGLYGVKFSTTSPEFCTDGMLEKCWIKDDSGIFLMKTGTSGAYNAGNEPLSEILCRQVLDRLGYNHASYSLEKFRGRTVSKSLLFTSDSLIYLPVSKVWGENSFSRLRLLLNTAKEFNCSKEFSEMLVFDYLVQNTDRHANNFGLLYDSETYKYLGFAPLFDNGCGMLCYWNGDDDIYEYSKRVDREAGPSLYDSFEVGARLGKSYLGNKHNVARLIDFEFDLSEIGDYPVNRVLKLQEWLNSRVRAFLDM